MDQLGQFVPMLLVLVVVWFLLIRPQNQERDAHAKLLASLEKDDQIVTASGIHGKIVAVRDDTVILEVGKNAQLTVDKTAVARRAGTPAPKT